MGECAWSGELGEHERRAAKAVAHADERGARAAGGAQGVGAARGAAGRAQHRVAERLGRERQRRRLRTRLAVPWQGRSPVRERERVGVGVEVGASGRGQGAGQGGPLTRPSPSAVPGKSIADITSSAAPRG